MMDLLLLSMVVKSWKNYSLKFVINEGNFNIKLRIRCKS